LLGGGTLLLAQVTKLRSEEAAYLGEFGIGTPISLGTTVLNTGAGTFDETLKFLHALAAHEGRVGSMRLAREGVRTRSRTSGSSVASRWLVAITTFVLTAVLSLPATAGAAPATDDDRQVAKAGVFQTSDFPAGWRATPHTKSKSDPFKCPTVEKAVSGLRKRRTADASSDDFERSNEQYTSNVIVFRTEDVARRAYKAVDSRAFRRCASEAVKDEVKKRGEEQGFDVKVETGTMTGTGSYGNQSSDIGFKITVTKGISIDLFGDIVFARVGRTLGIYSHVSDKEDSSCGEFSSSDCVSFNDLITAATNRLTTASGGQPASGTTQPRAAATKAHGEVRVVVFNAGGAPGGALRSG
jgi:hypothetical protein